MNVRRYFRTASRWGAIGLGFGVGCYATYVGVTWLRYGHVGQSATGEDSDPLLDRADV